MSESAYDEKQVVDYLAAIADIRDFYLHCFNETGRCLVQYFDKQGQPWALMEDDDQLIAQCVRFLRNEGVPEFYDVEQMKDFEAQKLKAVKSL